MTVFSGLGSFKYARSFELSLNFCFMQVNDAGNSTRTLKEPMSAKGRAGNMASCSDSQRTGIKQWEWALNLLGPED